MLNGGHRVGKRRQEHPAAIVALLPGIGQPAAQKCADDGKQADRPDNTLTMDSGASEFSSKAGPHAIAEKT